MVERGALEELLRIEMDRAPAEAPPVREHFAQFGDRLPQEFDRELMRLGVAKQ